MMNLGKNLLAEANQAAATVLTAQEKKVEGRVLLADVVSRIQGQWDQLERDLADAIARGNSLEEAMVDVRRDHAAELDRVRTEYAAQTNAIQRRADSKIEELELIARDTIARISDEAAETVSEVKSEYAALQERFEQLQVEKAAVDTDNENLREALTTLLAATHNSSRTMQEDDREVSALLSGLISRLDNSAVETVADADAVDLGQMDDGIANLLRRAAAETPLEQVEGEVVPLFERAERVA